MRPRLRRAAAIAGAALAAATPAAAAVAPPETALSQKSFRRPELFVPEAHQPLADLGELAPDLARELEDLAIAPGHGFFDMRTGRWSSLILSEPLIPGDGNSLRWVDLPGARARDGDAIGRRAWDALVGFLRRHQARLRVDLVELGPPRVGVFEAGALVQVHVPRLVGGVPVRDGSLAATISHGNLVLLGLRHWADVDAPRAEVGAEEARAAVARHVAPHVVERFRRGQRVELVPALRDGRYEFRLAWSVPVAIAGDLGSWEGLVDAASGELIAFEDRNHYAVRRILGGVYPVSNDQRPPDGVEQAGWPMPFANVTTGDGTITSTAGGTLDCSAGAATTALQGPFVRINDVCGPLDEASSGDLDLGFGPTPAATDCAVPPGHSAGDTKASRSGFYELNRIAEQARGYLPSNGWLRSALTANMNVNGTCNAFWNGSAVSFLRDDGSQCRNTGEIAAIFDHEWGHGMDDNGTDPGISQPGEGIADVHAYLRLYDSCVGRGFFKNQVCGGYGDPCDPPVATGCTGIRQMDFMGHVCDRPHTVTWITSGFTAAQCYGVARPPCPAGSGTPCNRAAHCEGKVVGETAYDLARRDLAGPPFGLDSNTAHELNTRLWYLGSQNVGFWYTCAVGGGCGATGGYLQLLAADDDNGNLGDGTPHMTAIRAAFERHEIHCAAPPAVDSGCAGGPAAAPVVAATPVDGGVALSWGAVGGAARYSVYRTEGVAGCDFGKIKVGETSGTSFADAGLLNGRAYSYVVLPVGSNPSCFGRASACVTATPVPGANLAIRPRFVLSVPGGDADEFLDNCEDATITFTVENSGTGVLSNVRLVAVTPLTHPATVVQTPLPLPIAASLADCQAASAGVSIRPQGMTFDQGTQLRLVVTADEIAPATRSQVVTVANVESNWSGRPSQTFGFDTGWESWTVRSGTWTRAGSGAGGTPFHLSSSEYLPSQCDVIRSPLVRLSAASTLSLQDNFDIEGTDPQGGPYDRANVGVVDTERGTRTVVSPDSGTTYTVAAGPTPNYTECELGGQAGWNGRSPGYPAFAPSGWTAAALNPGGVFTGRRVHLEIRYGTDPALHPEGFDFDQAVLTSFDLQTPDQQGNTCVAQAAEPAGLCVDCAGNGVLSPGETVVVAPSWQNTGMQPLALTGVAANFTGPPGAVYTIADATAAYGILPSGATQACTDCYALGVAASMRPVQHWHASVEETVSPTSTAKTWTLHVGDSFADVPAASGYYRFIETIFHAGVTGGCAAGRYCPAAAASREQMAVFVLRAREGAGYVPPACGTPLFADVPASSPYCPFIEEMARRGLVAGCGGGNYCPAADVLREQMAVFVLRALEPTVLPPACVAGAEMFDDVPASSPYCRWIEELARRGVVAGCGGGSYCPAGPVTREQMAVFLAATFGLSLYGL